MLTHSVEGLEHFDSLDISDIRYSWVSILLVTSLPTLMSAVQKMSPLKGRHVKASLGDLCGLDKEQWQGEKAKSTPCSTPVALPQALPATGDRM